MPAPQTPHASAPDAAPPPADRTLEQRYAEVQARIAAAARRTGRGPDGVVLVAVTKYAEQDQLRSLIQLGHRDFGESRVQNLVQRAGMVEEFLSRRRTLPHARKPGEATGSGEFVRWHMIGHLQRNKVRRAVEVCRLIQSVDSLRLAEEIQQAAMKREEPVDVLVQVNCSGQNSKFGCPLPAAGHLAEKIDTLVSVRVRGLMTMAPTPLPAADGGPPVIDLGAARDTFARCRELFDEMHKSGIGDGRFNILSMGMSGDFEVAIEEGANLVRVGSAIFGEPKHPTGENEAEPPADGD